MLIWFGYLTAFLFILTTLLNDMGRCFVLRETTTAPFVVQEIIEEPFVVEEIITEITTDTTPTTTTTTDITPTTTITTDIDITSINASSVEFITEKIYATIENLPTDYIENDGSRTATIKSFDGKTNQTMVSPGRYSIFTSHLDKVENVTIKTNLYYDNLDELKLKKSDIIIVTAIFILLLLLCIAFVVLNLHK
uniref:Uncharacterized protein n=1 Tax=Onchocerca volvulus TaxID=6282 RepID=A0A8R1XLW7_ONCVO